MPPRATPPRRHSDKAITRASTLKHLSVEEIQRRVAATLTPVPFDTELLAHAKSWRKRAKKIHRRVYVPPLPPVDPEVPPPLQTLKRLLPPDTNNAVHSFLALLRTRFQEADNPMWWRARLADLIHGSSPAALMAEMLTLESSKDPTPPEKTH